MPTMRPAKGFDFSTAWSVRIDGMVDVLAGVVGGQRYGQPGCGPTPDGLPALKPSR